MVIVMNTIININIRNIDNYKGDGRYVILDVRNEEEYKKHHIDGAVNIPYRQIEYEEADLDRSKIYVVYCEHGGVSIMAAKKLFKRGYQVINTIGGLAAYERYKLKFN